VNKLLYTLLVLGLATPGIGQNEEEPYFSLASTRTFGSNGQPSVSVGAWNVTSLEFRVYRINDPVKFFAQLEDAHQFGGRVPIPTREPTMLERFHDWKRGIRANIRREVRGQFTEAPSAHIASLRSTPPPSIATKGTQYAEAPLLNAEQLVLTFIQPVQSKSRWESQTVNVDVKQKGIYLVEAVHKDLRAYTILMVSDIVSLTKAGRGRIVTFVADRNTGQPIAGAEVYSITRKSGASKAVETNSDGMAEFPPPPSHPGDTEEDVRVLARRGADVAATTLSSYAFASQRDRMTGYIYTDRPVYRPGHTVHFKGILRLRAAVGYEVPAAQDVSVEIQDQDQKPVYHKTLKTTANGTVQDEVALGPAASLGTYGLTIHYGESEASANFEVEEYKKPEYEVRVTPAKPRVLEGDTVQATIDSRYYFGEPVPGAKVKYAIYRSRYFYPLWYEADEDMTPETNNPDDQNAYADDNDQVADEEGVLDQDGKLNISFQTTVSEHHFDHRYRIEARVTDEAKREIAGTGWVIATYGSFMVNVDPNRYFYDPNSKGQFTVQARDYDNKPVQTSVHLELLLWNWRGEKGDVKASADVNTGADGSATADLNLPAQPGSYRARVTAKTPEGRTVDQYTYIYVAGSGEANWFGSDQKTVQIVPDKRSYRPGETAKLLFITGKPNTPVLVAIEGRDLRSQRLIRSKGSTAEFDIPITSDDEPAMFVTAHYIRGGELYQSTKRIKIPATEHRLAVQLSTDKPQYLPGDTATYSIDVKGSDGKPVPRANLSLGVVDEAIYAIRPDTTPDILNFFFGHEYNAVYTENSLNYFFNGEAGKRRMRLAELRPTSRLAQLKPERLVQPKIRKAFPDTAFWAADITTDASGHAQAKVPFPDSLTTWRASARAATADTKVGSTTLKTIVRKNLIMRLAVPRFFVQGDEVVISAIVHNYLTSDKTARVSLDMSGLDVLDGKTTDIRIPSRGEAKVDWRVKAQRVRSATITGKALTDEESDALELDLPVNPPGVKLSESKGGSIANSGAAALTLTFPQQVEPGSRALVIRVAPSIAGSLFGALEYLTSFPYGCVEQTMSSFLPDIIVKKVVQDLGLKENLDEAVLQQKIHAGLDRLYSFQHEDGGWGWWETDETHPFMTAYVVAGLVQARDAGTQVNQEAIDKGVEWLQKTAVPDTNLDRDLRAYIGYALQLASSSPLTNQLYGERTRLSPYGQALLGLTLELAKDNRAADLAASLEQSAKQDEQQAWWPATRDPMLDFSGDVTPEATAYVVKFLSHERPQSPLLPKAAQWLMNHRNEGYWWESTKQTAMVIYGLTDYLKSTNEMNPNLTATVYVNNQPVLTKKFDSSNASVETGLTLDESKLQPGANNVRITGVGQGRVYYSARAEYFTTEKKVQKTGTISLNILRDYFLLKPAKQGDKIVYDLEPSTGTVSSGDIITVRLTVTGTDWKYIMVEDPIPAGTEFITRDNLYELRNKPPWWDYYFTRREMHDDRMAIFQTFFDQGQKEYFYLLKVVNPGLFTVSPARVQPMYQPNFLATTESRRLEVK
jgi:alpha-2-macroglobulin